MKIIAVNPNPEELIHLSVSIRMATPPGTSVECFCDPLYAHQYAFHNQIDALYAVAQMNRLNGFELARTMRSRYPKLQIYLLWNNDDFRRDAKALGADGYIVTPATPQALKKAMEEAEKQEELVE